MNPDALPTLVEQAKNLIDAGRDQVAIVLDGPSGTGKTVTAAQLVKIANNYGLTALHFEGDRYLGALKDSAERRAMTNGDANDF